MPQFVHDRDTFMLAHMENSYTPENRAYGAVFNVQTNASAPLPKFYTSPFKFGSYALGCTGGSGHAAAWYQATLPDLSANDFHLDINKRFHIDYWVYFTALTDFSNNSILTLNTVTPCSIKFSTSTANFQLSITNSNNSTYTYAGSSGFFAGAWIHVGLERDTDTTVKLYLGGVLKSTLTVDAAYQFTAPGLSFSTNGLRLGFPSASATNVNSFYIDEIRCSTESKYSGDFTPPTSAYDA